MGYHNDCAGEVQQEIFQPVGGGDVQIVGRLVQQQQVGTAEQSLGQQDFHFQTGVHIGHLGLVQLHAYAQALQDTTGIALGFPAAQLCVLFLQFTGAHTVFVGHFLLGIQRFFFFADVIEALVAHDDGIHHGIGVVFVLILF